MLTNDIKKGMRIRLRNGWQGTMVDNRKGNIRMAEVEGIVKEIGSVYAYDIIGCQSTPGGEWEKIEHTPGQIKLSKLVKGVFGG